MSKERKLERTRQMKKLIKQTSIRNDKEYVNLYLCWTYQNKVYAVRIKPTFNKDFDKLVASAQNIPTGEDVEKYI